MYKFIQVCWYNFCVLLEYATALEHSYKIRTGILLSSLPFSNITLKTVNLKYPSNLLSLPMVSSELVLITVPCYVSTLIIQLYMYCAEPIVWRYNVVVISSILSCYKLHPMTYALKVMECPRHFSYIIGLKVLLLFSYYSFVL